MNRELTKEESEKAQELEDWEDKQEREAQFKITVMHKKCYECGELLTDIEVLIGMNRLVEANAQEFEGWVDCGGNHNEFIQPEDVIVLKKMGFDTDNDIEGIPVVCNKCVEIAAKNEGITLKRGL